MASESTPSQAARAQLREFREIVSDVVAELRSQELRDTYATITLTEVLNQQLAYLDGTSGRVPSRKQRLQAVHDKFKNRLAAIKATSPDAFRRHDPQSDVNTAPTSDGTGDG